MDKSSKPLFIGKLTMASVNLKAGADICSDTIPIYPCLMKGDKVDVLKIVATETDDPWCYIRTKDGITGYIQLCKVANAEDE